MSHDPRSVSPLFTQVDITAGAHLSRPRETHASTEEHTSLLRNILAAQDRQNELLEELVAHLVGTQRQRNNELGQWKQNNPELSQRCRQAAESLSKVQIEFLNAMTEEIDENAEAMMDGEFMLSEFVDRFGPRLAHLNGVLQVLAQLKQLLEPDLNVTMLVDLVQVTTADGLRLDGILELPAAKPDPPPPIDAWVCMHGTGSNFYSATLLAGLAPRLLRLGAAVLRVNTRGHDLVSSAATTEGRRLQGAALEIVDEGRHDVAAWVAFLAARGFARIGILGHSLGAVKGIYTLALDKPPPVAALVAISPPRLSHSYFLACPRGEEFRETFTTAEQHVWAGRPQTLMEVKFPLPYIVSAAAYIDRYGREERYNVLRHLDRIPCPTLASYGTREMQTDAAFAGMSEAVEGLRTPVNSLQVAVIAGADHVYTGVHDALADRIESWLRTLNRV